MENRNGLGPAGLYIHIPFCLRKCPYCDFYSITDVAGMDAYLAALKKEMRSVEKPAVRFGSIHIGGGTPSLLEPDHIDDILSRALSCFSFEKDVEIAVEVNPGAVGSEFLEAFLGAGGNRVNIGVQSFDNSRLAFLGRLHTAEQALEAIHLARTVGVTNLGLDLIYGLPGQSRDDWLFDLEGAVRCGPEHLSCYMLTFEEATPLDRRRKAGHFQPLKDGRVGALFEDTMRFLAENGYEQYEISNFSRGGAFPSRHNQMYWSHGSYIGLGPSAHSFISPCRWWNCDDLDAYLKRLAAGQPPVKGREILTQGQLMFESVFLGLRTVSGLDLCLLERRFGDDFRVCFSHALERLREQNLSGFVHVSENRCTLTEKGMVFADTISGVFAACMDLKGKDEPLR